MALNYEAPLASPRDFFMRDDRKLEVRHQDPLQLHEVRIKFREYRHIVWKGQMDQTHTHRGHGSFLSLHFYAFYEVLIHQSQDTLLDCIYKYTVLDFVVVRKRPSGKHVHQCKVDNKKNE
jgi:hypothetical protein